MHNKAVRPILAGVAKRRKINLREVSGAPPTVVVRKHWNVDVYVCAALVILVLGIYFPVVHYCFIN